MTSAAMIGAPLAELVLGEGLTTRVRVPASSANLGPGFDCLGLALGIYDDMTVTVTRGGVEVIVAGEAAGEVPLDDRHLVVRALRRGLEFAGVAVPGIRLECRNAIPHSRGLGSSASAVVGGLAAASGLLRRDGRRAGLTEPELVQLSGEFEGHPDNAAASVLGSAVVTWTTCGENPAYFARKLALHPSIAATVFIPGVCSSTAVTRALLPHQVPRADAVFNLSRSALAVVALTTDPSCLVDATTDRLHQGYRAPAMPATAELVAELRERGHAATVSGAGPCVLVLGTAPLDDREEALGAGLGFVMTEVAIAGGVQILD